jgi:hypothetical protein
MKTRGRRDPTWSAGTSSNRSVTRWPTWYTANHATLFTSSVLRAQHTLSDRYDLLLGVLTEGFAMVRVDLAEVDVEPHHVAALARDQQDVALIRGPD